MCVNRLKLSVLTVTADEGHGFIAAVGWKSSIATSANGSGRSPPSLQTSVLLVLAGADANDAMHQPALGLALLQVKVLGNTVDELADLVSLAGEGGVRGAAGQLVDLVQGVQLQQFLADQRIHVTQLLCFFLLVIVQRQKTGTTDRAAAVPNTRPAGCSAPLGGGDRVHYRLACDANIRVAEAVTGGQLGMSAGLAISSQAPSTPLWTGLCASFGRVVCGTFSASGSYGQTWLPAAIEATGEKAADKRLAGAPAQGAAGSTCMPACWPATVS